MVALVTGAGGFLGGYVADRLDADGMEVVKSGRPAHEIPSPAFDALLQRTEPGLVVHCATPASVQASIEDPDADREGSVDVLAALLDRLGALRSRPRLVFVGSAAVYGEPRDLPIREDRQCEPISPYGRHRAECEAMLRGRDVAAVALRVFSAYGEGLRRQVLWDICRKALEDGHVDLAGTGSETRDFVHARDVAAAVAAIAAGARFEGEAYNVATGVATPIADLAEMLVSALGGGAPVSFDGQARPGDPEHWQADVGRLGALGWRPAIALPDGAARYARWAARELGRSAPVA